MSTIIAGAACAKRFKQQIHRRLLPIVGASQLQGAHSQETHRLQQLRAGEAEAWTQLLAEWGPRLYSYLMENLGDEAAAQQSLQALLRKGAQSCTTHQNWAPQEQALQQRSLYTMAATLPTSLLWFFLK